MIIALNRLIGAVQPNTYRNNAEINSAAECND